MSFWSILRTPSAFTKDAYAYATNQMAHATVVGFGGCSVLAFLCSVVFEPWPDQRIVFGVVVLTYALAWEWGVQKWRGWDSVEDVVFVAIGSSGFLLIDMSLVIVETLCVYGAIMLALAPGIYRRKKAAQDGN